MTAEFTCFKCGDGNTPLYCLNCAGAHAEQRIRELETLILHDRIERDERKAAADFANLACDRLRAELDAATKSRDDFYEEITYCMSELEPLDCVPQNANPLSGIKALVAEVERLRAQLDFHQVNTKFVLEKMKTDRDEARAELAAAREALAGLIKMNEDHNAAIESVIGRPLNWTDDYLDDARKILAAITRQPTPDEVRPAIFDPEHYPEDRSHTEEKES